MKSSFVFNDTEITLERYPKTSNRSLQPFSNAELLGLDYIAEKKIEKVHIFNDRFGVWNCALHDKEVITIWNYASQQKAIAQNLKLNNYSMNDQIFKTPLDDLKQVEMALLKVPKSLELFELFLQQIHQASTDTTEVVCGFMTKYFNASMLTIASKYFEDLTQTKAWKKARLLVLSKPKREIEYTKLMNTIQWKEQELKQYFGVFSSGKIDIGTQYLLEDLYIRDSEVAILDLASGNGVIALEALQLNSKAQVTLIDDSFLAVASSKLNVKDRATFLCDNELSELESNSFDLVLSNPPFHFEFENNIEISIQLFKDVRRCLKERGRFVLVSNKHLNYKTHLQKEFRAVTQLKSNDKFEVLECVK
ncbi:methyltransferase [Pseudotenacibaculum haliotis]|uniref:Methyltransferase n=1 Tax=Pseudotenacibaculum haliotis TaxID=1862138 RepID=A0ABW5LQ58_9FLAO